MAYQTKKMKREKKADLLLNNFKYYSKNCLKILDKSGNLRSLILNRAQRYVHELLEKQLMDTGKVRALILKGRQQGCSTYVGGRYFHKASTKQGKTVFILSHDSLTTEKLYNMVERYRDNVPETIRVATKVSNRRQMKFEGINSEYIVGTAGNEEIGRGSTIQYFHGSEVASWKHTEELETGIFQAVADIDGTEIILESTAKGMSGMFYEKCMDAIKGKGQFQLIFVPWFWQNEYEKETPADFKLEPEEEQYIQTYLTEYQRAKAIRKIYWRRLKIEEFRSEWKFMQEYPSNPMEAFQTSGDSLISNEVIMKARKANIEDKHAPLILGVDPARSGDRTSFVFRRGRKIIRYYCFYDMDEMLIAGKVGKYLNTYPIVQCFIDVGLGYGVVDRLKELGYGNRVRGVHFGEAAMEKDIYLNKRAEMWVALRDWLEAGADIPDDDDLHSDLSCMPEYVDTSSGRLKFPDKDKIREEYGKSPDIGDAAALTFAYPVATEAVKNIMRKNIKRKSSISTLQRMRRK